MKSNLSVLRQLDNQQLISKQRGAANIPKQGWVRTIRKALGMTIKQLARRLQVDPSRVVKIETSEIEGATTLRTLQAVAKAFDCTLVYSFIPNKSFEEMVKVQARKIAVEQVARTAHTMDLEAQSVDQQWLDQQAKELTEQLLQKSWKYLWEE